MFLLKIVFTLAILGFAALRSGAAHGDELVTLNTRPGISQSFLLLEPKDTAKGVAILLPGHKGEIKFGKTSDGNYEIAKVPGGGLTASRAMRERLRQGGFAVAIIAPPSDRNQLSPEFRKSTEHFEDIRVVIDYLQNRYGSKPSLHGSCLASLSVASIATRLRGDGISRVVLSSARSTGKAGAVTEFERGAVKMPVLLVNHRDDSCPYTPYGNVDQVKAFFQVSTPKVDLITVTGGDSKLKKKSTSCQDGFHGFKGTEKDTAQAGVSWLLDEKFSSHIEGAQQ